MQENPLSFDSRETCIRVLVVDDEEMSRLGLTAALTGASGVTVVGHAPARKAEPASLLARRPHVVLLNTRTDGDWADLVRGMRASVPTSGRPGVIVVIDGHDEQRVLEAVYAGASGVLLRDMSAAELDYAVRQVAMGHAVLSAAVTSWMLARWQALAALGGHGLPDSRAISALSDREREILAALAVGKTNQEIAAETHLSLATVKSHVSSVLAKLDVRDRFQAALLGVSAGICS